MSCMMLNNSVEVFSTKRGSKVRKMFTKWGKQVGSESILFFLFIKSFCEFLGTRKEKRESGGYLLTLGRGRTMAPSLSRLGYMSQRRLSIDRQWLATSDSLITDGPVSKMVHFSCATVLRVRQPSIPWAQHLISALIFPEVNCSFSSSGEKGPLLFFSASVVYHSLSFSLFMSPASIRLDWRGVTALSTWRWERVRRSTSRRTPPPSIKALALSLTSKSWRKKE